MDIKILKILAAVVLWVVIFGFGLIPIKWKGVRQSKRAMAYSNCFSGGLFIAIGLIHILPEAHFLLEAPHEETGKNQKQPFPVSYLICLLTFSFLLFIDKVWLNNIEAQVDADGHDDGKHGHKKSNEHQLGASLVPKKYREDKNKPKTKEQKLEEVEEAFRRQLSSTQKIALNFKPVRVIEENYCCTEDHLTRRQGPDHKCSESDISGGMCESSFAEDPDESLPMLPQDKQMHLALRFEESAKTSKKDPEDIGHHHHAPIIGKETSTIKVYIILVAMGIHGIFSGLALGVCITKEDLFYLFLAMLFHKWSEAFTVGVSFVRSKVPEKRAILMIFVFSIFTPLGILIGLLIPSTDTTLVGVCFALSAGSFLYIASAEIILDEFAMPTYRYTKFLFYMLGIAFVAAMGLMED